MRTSPNIVFIFSEEWRVQATGYRLSHAGRRLFQPDWFKKERGYTTHDYPGELFDLREDIALRSEKVLPLSLFAGRARCRICPYYYCRRR